MEWHPQHDLPGPRKDVFGGPERPPSARSVRRFGEYILGKVNRKRGEGGDPLPVAPPAKPFPMTGGAAARPDEDG